MVQNEMEYSTFHGSFFYMLKMILGLADDRPFGDLSTWNRMWMRFFFILAAFLIVIILLNMLIAIMNDT